MSLEVSIIKKENKVELKQMLLDYFKEIDTSKVIQTIKGAEIDYPYLDAYWEETTRIPINFFYNGELIGFALINNWIICKTYKADHSIAEFYVKPTYRRKGMGKKVAYKLFNTYKGKWEVRQSLTNSSALKFWRTIISEFTKGDFEEVQKVENKETSMIQLFESK